MAVILIIAAAMFEIFLELNFSDGVGISNTHKLDGLHCWFQSNCDWIFLSIIISYNIYTIHSIVFILFAINLVILFACHIAITIYRDDNLFFFRFYLPVFVVCPLSSARARRNCLRDSLSMRWLSTIGRSHFFHFFSFTSLFRFTDKCDAICGLR